MTTTESQGSGRRVLLVDGDWPRSIARAEALVRCGWEVDLATSAEHALAAIDQALPDALVSEALCSGSIGGSELAALLKRDMRTKHLPVVVLTDAVSADALVDALAREVALADLLALRRARREGGADSHPTPMRQRLRDQRV